MKAKTWKLFYMLGILAVGGALVLLAGRGTNANAATSRTQDDDHFHGQELVGTWRVNVTLLPCPGAPASPSVTFPSLISFAADGTMAENTSSPVFALAQRGPGLGVWNREGKRTYQAKSIAFILFTTAANVPGTPGFNPTLPVTPGFTAGTQTITQTIEFDKGNSDEFSSTAAISFADAGGNPYRQGCATAVGARFQ